MVQNGCILITKVTSAWRLQAYCNSTFCCRQHQTLQRGAEILRLGQFRAIFTCIGTVYADMVRISLEALSTPVTLSETHECVMARRGSGQSDYSLKEQSIQPATGTKELRRYRSAKTSLRKLRTRAGKMHAWFSYCFLRWVFFSVLAAFVSLITSSTCGIAWNKELAALHRNNLQHRL